MLLPRLRCTSAALLFACLSISSLAHASDARPDGTALIRKAVELTDLREAGPFHMHAQLAMQDPYLRKDVVGQDDVYWQSSEKWRRELRLTDYYSESALILEGQIYRLRNPAFTPPAGRRDLAATLRRLPEELTRKVDRVSRRTIAGTPAQCVSLHANARLDSNWCFDEATGLPLAWFGNYFDSRIEFSDYTPFGAKFVPGKIQAFARDHVLASATIDPVRAELPSDPRLFQPFAGVHGYPWCDEVGHPQVDDIFRSGPELPLTARTAKGLQLFYEVSVDASGNVSNVVPMEEDAPYDRIVMQWMAGRRYQPAMCGRTPVPTDFVMSVGRRL